MRHVGILLHRFGVLKIVGGIRQDKFVIEFAVGFQLPHKTLTLPLRQVEPGQHRDQTCRL